DRRGAVENLPFVRVRAARRRITSVRAFDACQLVTTVGADAATAGIVRRFLAPFDDLEPIDARTGAHRVRPRPWRRACPAPAAADAPPGALRSAARARIDLLPHQLEPALAILRGDGTRVLLADDVGLGKTIQAGLILSELLDRQAIDRVLILTPAGLRTQW